jgi:P27 family predicted phage terminase small subunit
MHGPKPTPTEIKKLRGNPGHRALNENEPQPPDGKLTCPQFLDGVARRKWYKLLSITTAMGTAKPIDEDLLAAYCSEYGRWVEAERILKRTGPIIKTKNDNLIQSPLIGVSNRAQELMLKYGAELGIGAATRSRLNATDARKESGIAKMLTHAKRQN